MYFRLLLKKFFLLFSLFIFGCSNYIRTDTDKETQISRKTLSSQSYIANEPEIRPTGTIVIITNRQITEQVTTEEHNRIVDIATPYQGYRETYEIPSGILLLPGAIVVNVADFALLGLIPNKMTDDLLDYSMTGMNPFLNWENEHRVERTVISDTTRTIDTKKDTYTLAPEYLDIILIPNTKEIVKLTTNKYGILKVLLPEIVVDYIKNPENLHYIDLYIGSSPTPARRLVISRNLSYNLCQLKVLVHNLRKNPTSENLASTVIKIENLNFDEYALIIEQYYLNLNKSDKDFAKKYNDLIQNSSLIIPTSP